MRTSEVLTRLANEPGDRLSVDAIFHNLGDRAFAALVVILGLANCTPIPPPLPLLCAIFLLFVAFQMTFGRRSPWAPKVVLSRSVAQADMRRAIEKVMPILAKLERWTRPRMTWLQAGPGAIVMGVILIFLSLGLLTAAPFIGQIPWGVAICMFGLALVERDGVLIIASLVMGAIASILSAGFVYAIFIAIKGLVV